MRRRVLAAACSIVGVLHFAACDIGKSGDPSSDIGGQDQAPEGSPSLPKPPSRETESMVDVAVLDTDEPAQASSGEGAGYALAPSALPPIILYLNRNGARVTQGRNDSAANTSQIVTGDTTFPPSSYAGQDARWARLVATVKDHFARYNVSIVEQEPVSGSYLEAIITSGSPSLIGYGNTLGGIAPTRCGIVAASIAFIFDHGGHDEISTAEIVSHELGHSLSLSHTQPASDLMSYSNQTPKKFEDLSAQCGTRPGQTEKCNCPGTTQNNHQQLLTYVGPVQASSPDAGSPDAGPPVEPPATSVSIVSPANNSTYTPNTTVEVKADATRVTGIQKMVLHWKIDTRMYEYPCPSSSCSSSNGIYTWRIVPGGGDRNFYARATTTAGTTVDSPTVRITQVVTPPTPPPDAGAPVSDANSFCIDEINRYRATVGVPALARWDSAQTCTANQCKNDAASQTPHGSFGACGELAQNECPGWTGWTGDPKNVMKNCLEMMWDEGPGGGHYENMKNTAYTKVSCNYFKDTNGQVTAIQNFR